MSRPAGVTATAVVQFLGSAFTLIVGVLIIFGAMVAPDQPPGFVPIAATMFAVLIVLAALGVWTGIALLKLRPWARTSTLVFAGIMSVMSAMLVVVMAIVPLPTVQDAKQQAAMAAIRPVMMVMYGLPLIIGVWWLVYFNRTATKAAFAEPPVPGEAPARPLSISIIGWFTAVGGAFVIPFAFSGLPAFFGIIFTGFSAKVVYVLMGGTGLYLGWSVLRLQEIGRRAMIGYYTLTMAHGAYVAFAPSGHAKFVEAQRLMALDMKSPMSFDMSSTSATTVFMMLGVAFGVVVIGFLVKERARFS